MLDFAHEAIKKIKIYIENNFCIHSTKLGLENKIFFKSQVVRVVFVTLVFIVVFCDFARAADASSPIAIDNRMRTLVYSPNEVFRLKFKVGYQSHIVFPQDETPILQSFGDARGWSVKLVGTSLFIKPLDPGLQTNMIMETTKNRVYYFEISSTFNDDESDDDFAYRVNFFYPDQVVDAPMLSKKRGTLTGELKLPNGQRDPVESGGANFNYSFAGVSKDIRPTKVFDDGVKTYFLFANHNEKIPMIYAVNELGIEELLHYKIADSYVVVDSTEYQYTLRLGKDLVCIFNEKYVSIGR